MKLRSAKRANTRRKIRIRNGDEGAGFSVMNFRFSGCLAQNGEQLMYTREVRVTRRLFCRRRCRLRSA